MKTKKTDRSELVDEIVKNFLERFPDHKLPEEKNTDIPQKEKVVEYPAERFKVRIKTK